MAVIPKKKTRTRDEDPFADDGPRPILPLLAEAKEAVQEDLHRRLREAGFPDLRPAHGCVFRFVGEEGIRLTDLAALNQITKQSVGEIVDDLERLGHVERIPDPSDKRAKLVKLTAAGREAQEFARSAFGDIERDWAERLGASRVTAMREALTAIAAERGPRPPGA